MFYANTLTLHCLVRGSIQFFILFKEGIIIKIFYERRDYESVDEKSLSLSLSRKTTKKEIQAVKG